MMFPHLGRLRIDEVGEAAGMLWVRARTVVPSAACQVCGVASSRVHSCYERRVADQAVSGREVMITLAVRRFRCVNHGCERKIFADDLSPNRSPTWPNATNGAPAGRR